MDKKRGIINVTVSVTFKIILLIVNILVRRCLIRTIGNEINGINSLYNSILDFLAVTELGVGTAISFCMYKPIVEGDDAKVSALYGLFIKLYLIIGAIILAGGCLLMPLLPYLAKDYQSINVNLYLTFAITLVSVVMSYVFSAKISLINAYKNNYIATLISSLGLLLQYVLQIVVLTFTSSFVGFVICRAVAMAMQWVATEIIARKKHGAIIADKQKIDEATKKEVTKNIKAMFMHKIGGVLVNTADSLIISAFIGVVLLGKYSNYTAIVIAMGTVLGLCFSPLTSVIGHMYVSEDKEQAKKYLNFFHTFNFVLGIVFYLGYYAVIDNLVAILFAGGLELRKSVSFVITLNYFIQFMRQAMFLFRDAAGTFYYDRWKSVAEGLVNIALSIGFVFLFKYIWGDDFAVVGVIAATIVTTMTICHIVEPHVMYKYALKSDAKNYYIRNYAYIAIFTAALVALHFCMVSTGNQWTELLINGCISLAISLTISAVIMLCNKDFRYYMKNMVQKLLRKKQRQAETVPLQNEEAESGSPTESEAATDGQEQNE